MTDTRWQRLKRFSREVDDEARRRRRLATRWSYAPMFMGFGVGVAYYAPALGIVAGIAIGAAMVMALAYGTRDERIHRDGGEAALMTIGMSFGLAVAYEAGQQLWGWPNIEPFAALGALGALMAMSGIVVWIKNR